MVAPNIGGVSIPVNLNLGNFQQQINAVRTSVTKLSSPIQAFSGGAKQALFDTALGALKVSNAFVGLSNPIGGANAGILKFGITSSKYLSYAAFAMQPLINQLNTLQTFTNLGQIFAPITTNAILLNQIASKYTSGGLTFYGRYLDYVKMAAVLKEINQIVPKKGLLYFGLDAVSQPQKVARELAAMGAAARLTIAQINAIKTSINTIQLDVLRSAGSLLSGGGFVAPGQAAGMPTVFDMFDTRQAIQSRVAFEQMVEPLQNIQKISGFTSKEISRFENNLLNLSLRSRQSIESLSLSTQAMLMQGKSASESKNDLADLANIATGTSTDLRALTDATLEVQQAFKGIAAKDIASALSVVSLQTGTAVNQYSNAIKNLNPAIQESGQSLSDVLTILGQLSNAGFEGEEAGSKLNQLFNSLNDLASGSAPKFAQSGLLQLGINPEEFVNAQGQLKSILDISNLIRERVAAFSKTNGSANTQGILASVFGTREANTVTALLQASREEIDKLNNSIAGSNGLTKTLADSKSETFTAQLQKLSDSASIVSTKIGGVVVPVFQAILTPIANVVSAFAQLPPAVIAGTIAFNAAIPPLLLYFTGVRSYVQITKLAPLGQVLWNGALDLSSGKLTVNALATKALAEAQKLAALANGVLAGSYQLLTGQMSLATAKQNIFNAVTVFGNANLKEFLSTTAATTKIMVKHAATLGLVAVAFNVYSELMRKSEGAKFAEQLRKSTDEIARFDEQLKKTNPSVNTFQDYLSNLGDIAQQRGWIEAIRTGLVDLDATLLGTTGSLDAYGQQWGSITGTQLGNQKAMVALDSTLTALHYQLDNGNNLLSMYQKGQKLSIGESEAYKKSISQQVETLNKYKEALQKQQAPTKEQQELQKANITLVEKQISVLQGRIKGLNDEGNTIKNIILPSYDELISKYDELNRKAKLENTNQQINIEQSFVSGDISTVEAQQRRFLLEQEKINEELKRTEALRKDLEVSAVGAGDEQRAKIQNEINQSIQKEADLRLEAVKSQGNINQFQQQQEIEKANELILQQQTKEKVAQLKLEQDIAAQKITGNQIEEERYKLQLASLQASLAANQAAQKQLSGQRGEAVKTEQKKLQDEAIEIQKQIAQAQIQENDRVTQLRVEAEEKVKQEALKKIEERLQYEQTKINEQINKLDIKSSESKFKSNELESQQKVSETLANLESQRSQFQLDLANRSQDIARIEQSKLAIYEQQKAQISQQQQLQSESIKLSREQQQIEFEKNKISAQLAITEAQINLEKARASGASTAEIQSLQSAISIRQSQLDLIAKEQESINKINANEDKRINLENQIKTEQLEQQRTLELQDLAVQKITAELDKQKAVIDAQVAKLELSNKAYERQSQLVQAQQQLAESNANLEKQRLDFQLELANRANDFNKAEQTKAAIFLQQREEILRQAEAQQASVKLSQQQAGLELQRQQLTAQTALLEAQANVERAKAQGVTGQQLTTLQQSITLQQQQLEAIKQQGQVNAQVQATEQQRLDVENKIKLEQLEQQRQLELLDSKQKQIDEAERKRKEQLEELEKRREEQANRVAEAYERQKQELDLVNQTIELGVSKLNQQSSLIDAQNSFAQAQATLEKQRLDYQLQLAEIIGDETQKQQLKQAIYEEELNTLKLQQQAAIDKLKISEAQQKIDIERQKISAEIATLEAQANIEQARVKGVSEVELNALNKILDLRKQQQQAVLDEQQNIEKIQQLERQRLKTEQQASLEQLTQNKYLEDARLMQEKLNEEKQKADSISEKQNKIESKKPDYVVNSTSSKDFGARYQTVETGTGTTVRENSTVRQVSYKGDMAGEPLTETSFNSSSDMLAAQSTAQINVNQQEFLNKNMTQSPNVNQPNVWSGQTWGSNQNQISNPMDNIQNKISDDKGTNKLLLDTAVKSSEIAITVSQILGVLQSGAVGGAGAKIDNVMVISSDPTGDAREVIQQLTKMKRNC